MNRLDAAEFALEALKKAGADKAQVSTSTTNKQELNVESDEITLFRTVINQSLSLKAIKNQRQGNTSVNKLDKESILKAVEEVMGLIEGGSVDEAYDISPGPKKKKFENGVLHPDQDKMYSRLSELMDYSKKEFPKIIQEGVHVDHTKLDHVLLNSNGVEFVSTQGYYGFTSMFTAKEGGKASSFNYTGGTLRDLNNPLLDCFGLKELLAQSSEQIHTKPVPGKFQGDIVLTPHCFSSILGAYLGLLGDSSMIAGTSLFKDKFGEKIAGPITVHSDPFAQDQAAFEFYTGEGFETEKMTVLDQGVLKSFLLSHYGSKKTGKERAKNSGGNISVLPGTDHRSDLIKSIKKGILLCRFSGGRPVDNGDFSGVAKNSYYIENGEIQYPVSETMISGNLVDFFKNVSGISKEYISNGQSKYPWMKTSGVTISGN